MFLMSADEQLAAYIRKSPQRRPIFSQSLLMTEGKLRLKQWFTEVSQYWKPLCSGSQTVFLILALSLHQQTGGTCPAWNRLRQDLPERSTIASVGLVEATETHGCCKSRRKIPWETEQEDRVWLHHHGFAALHSIKPQLREEKLSRPTHHQPSYEIQCSWSPYLKKMETRAQFVFLINK